MFWGSICTFLATLGQKVRARVGESPLRHKTKALLYCGRKRKARGIGKQKDEGSDNSHNASTPQRLNAHAQSSTKTRTTQRERLMSLTLPSASLTLLAAAGAAVPGPAEKHAETQGNIVFCGIHGLNLGSRKILTSVTCLRNLYYKALTVQTMI